MSLDIYFSLDSAILRKKTQVFVRENGQTRELSLEEIKKRFPDSELAIENEGYEISNDVFDANITHNLGKMADEAGVYQYLWEVEKNNITVAEQLIEPLTKGLELLRANPAHFEQFNPSNGWGDYDGLVNFVQKVLNACKEYPEAKVRVSR